MAIYNIAIGKSGSAYPRIKSDAESEEVKSLIKNEVLLSLAINVPENKAMTEQ